MLRRLFALIVLVALAVAGLYYWKSRADAPRQLKNLHLPKLDKVEDAIRERAIATSVRTAFALNRTLQASSIDVSSEDGVVTLRGAVPSDAARTAAERVAAQVPEVKQVVNHLKVEAGSAEPSGQDRTLGETVDDKKLEVQVHLALSLNRKLQGVNFDVKSFKRDVILSGEVESQEQKELAADVVKEVPGVASVKDELRIRPSKS